MKNNNTFRNPAFSRDYNDDGTIEDGFGSSELDRVDMILESPPSKTALGSGVPIQQYNRVLGTLSVAAITFFYGCGGPFGSEEVVRLGGPLPGILALVIYPLVYTIPYGFVIVELCSAFPEDGGFTIWATNAFGYFWGVQIGYWAWVAGVVAGAIYPTYLIMQAQAYLGLGEVSKTTDTILRLCFALCLAIPTLAPAKAFGRGAITFLLLAIISATIFSIWGFASFSSDNHISVVRHKHSTIANFTDPEEYENGIENSVITIINAAFWNFDGIQMASVFGGQVANPSRVYSRAIWITMASTISIYFFPLFGTLLSDSVSWWTFSRPTYVDAGLAIGGQFLRVVMIIASFISSVGLFMGNLFCQSFQIAGMADNRLLPQGLAVRSQMTGSPYRSVFATLSVSMLLGIVGTDSLLPVTNTFAALVSLTIFLSAIRLRFTLPYIPRPTKLPGGTPGLIVVSLIPMCICGLLIGRNITLGVQEGLMVAGFLMPGLLYGFFRSRQYQFS
ncbi:hypothetical protein P43SY_000155 [Pythium insidiosum]|uniref:Uncharacterized protein n=1 Tax=Pythium insidiosum TaxID=114742 RepID=A0AAD5LD68_PYTIN|nr:hypothetical protein P43SY_000155 [Pythium insidiosum]